MSHITKKLLTALMITSLIGFSGCSAPVATAPQPIETPKISIVTTLFPQYDFAKHIAGDLAEVTLLLPPGVEPHAYEPTPKDITRIQNATLFIYTSENMEPWVKKLISGLDTTKVSIVEASKNITYLEGHEDHEAHEETPGNTEETTHEDEHGSHDPHVWTDPQNALIMVDNITTALSKADPSHATTYESNAVTYKESLKNLDQTIQTTLEKATQRDIIYGGHSAMTYFANRYDLHIHTAYESMSPDAEPTSKNVAALIDYVKKNKVTAIFYEELVNPRIAEVISNETGAEMLLLHGAHNISADEIKDGVTYIQIMEGNLERLKKGMSIHD